MNATRVPQPVPAPPDRILLEMSEEEANALYFIACRNVIIPNALRAGGYALDAERIEKFQDALRSVLRAAGIIL